jgi:asparagine synthase (glutamine-hydrolysing)
VPPDGPIGVLLSSGVDSKLMVAMLVGVLGRDPRDVHTFTYRYTNYDGGWNEGGPARDAAAHFGTVHQEIAFAPDVVADNLDRMLRSYGEPFTYGVHSFLLDPVREAGIARVITGAGADGWYRSRNERKARAIHDASPLAVMGLRSAAAVAGRIAGAAARLPRVNRYAEGLAWRLDELDWVARTGIPWRSGPSIFPRRLRRRVYADPSWADRGAAAAGARFAEATADIAAYRDDVRFPFVHFRFFVAEGAHQWYAACARASGLRFDHPFFDDDVIDLLARLERPEPNKAEFRRLAETLMPREMAQVPKVPQTVPIRQWFRGPLRGFLCDGLARDRLVRHGLFDPDGVGRMIAQHVRGEINHEWRLWGILAATAWRDAVLAAPATPA